MKVKCKYIVQILYEKKKNKNKKQKNKTKTKTKTKTYRHVILL